MSLQIKKPLSAQAVGTNMYKNGGVGQVQPAAEQRNTKRWRTEIKTCDVQPDSDPDGHQETLWLSSSDRPHTRPEAGLIRFMLFLCVDAERFWILSVFRILEGWSEFMSSGGDKEDAGWDKTCSSLRGWDERERNCSRPPPGPLTWTSRIQWSKDLRDPGHQDLQVLQTTWQEDKTTKNHTSYFLHPTFLAGSECFQVWFLNRFFVEPQNSSFFFFF